ncbi:hypothetical protein BAE44_0015999 [Dichanthelium oligosanthes]|uniref:NAC domain-containing protein n=1 Tax=Dichanthelium oligosanthes TaxID=888268 RepID=A0A1E5VCV7_9POAL|nr:hypothetical protein BAE44_0015999 [Dichanthelium oligosanthes]
MLRPPPRIPIPSSLLAAAAAFDSHPSDLVLIKSYLRPWVAQGVLAGAFLHAADVYSAEPADLVRRYRPAVARDGERVWYFLSPLRTKSPRGRRKSRTVAGGTGWWHGEAGPKRVLDPLDGRRHVGYRQNFSFMRRGEDGAPVRTGWIMMELRLHDGDDRGGLADMLEGLVLCKVYRSPRHPETAAAAADDEDGEEESCEVTVAAPAPAGSHSDVADDGGSSEAPPVVAVSGGKRKADDDEGSSGATAATPRHHIKNAANVLGVKVKAAADDENERHVKNAANVLGVKEKAAADDENEISGATTAAAPGRKEAKAADADADEDSSTSSRARKRAKTADGEGAGAASACKKNAGVPATQLHCPQCGFHLGVLQAVVAPAKSVSETERDTGIARSDAAAPQGGGRTADASGKDPSFQTFF